MTLLAPSLLDPVELGSFDTPPISISDLIYTGTTDEPRAFVVAIVFNSDGTADIVIQHSPVLPQDTSIAIPGVWHDDQPTVPGAPVYQWQETTNLTGTWSTPAPPTTWTSIMSGGSLRMAPSGIESNQASGIFEIRNASTEVVMARFLIDITATRTA